jgi:hypothetical protein
MKLLFGFLLVLSVGLFAFMQWGGTLTGAAKNAQTLAELNPEKIRLLDRPATRAMPASAVQPVSQVLAVSAAAAASVPTAPPSVVNAPALPPVASAPVATALPLPVPALAPAREPVPVQGGKPVATRACMEWGEFSGTDLARASNALAGLKLGDRLTQRTVEYASGYWVYIPPLANKAAVNKKIAEIRAAGVEDYFVVQESRKWFNAISLGVFKTREAAKNFQSSMKKKGLSTAQVGERKRMLKFTVFELNRIDAEAAARLAVLHKAYANSELAVVACK